MGTCQDILSNQNPADDDPAGLKSPTPPTLSTEHAAGAALLRVPSPDGLFDRGLAPRPVLDALCDVLEACLDGGLISTASPVYKDLEWIHIGLVVLPREVSHLYAERIAERLWDDALAQEYYA